MDILNGTLTEKELDLDDDDYTSLESELAFSGRENTRKAETFDFANRCARSIPCYQCLRGLNPETLQAIGVERQTDFHGNDIFRTPDGKQARGVAVGHVNPYCGNKGSKIARLSAPVSGRIQPGN